MYVMLHSKCVFFTLTAEGGIQKTVVYVGL